MDQELVCGYQNTNAFILISSLPIPLLSNFLCAFQTNNAKRLTTKKNKSRSCSNYTFVIERGSNKLQGSQSAISSAEASPLEASTLENKIEASRWIYRDGATKSAILVRGITGECSIPA